MRQVNFPFIDHCIVMSLQFISDRAGGNGTKELAVIAGLHLNGERELGKGLGKFSHRLQVMGFTLCPTLSQHLEAALIGRGDWDGEALRKKIIARIAGGDLHVV